MQPKTQRVLSILDLKDEAKTFPDAQSLGRSIIHVTNSLADEVGRLVSATYPSDLAIRSVEKDYAVATRVFNAAHGHLTSAQTALEEHDRSISTLLRRMVRRPDPHGDELRKTLKDAKAAVAKADATREATGVAVRDALIVSKASRKLESAANRARISDLKLAQQCLREASSWIDDLPPGTPLSIANALDFSSDRGIKPSPQKPAAQSKSDRHNRLSASSSSSDTTTPVDNTPSLVAIATAVAVSSFDSTPSASTSCSPDFSSGGGF